ncbi:uncharacterized protein A4U43_C04F22870 [Asparagus officinalis]|uniref:Uncharacterized protein n=1 Tax=Asparagus officinalis TaxID=4686 RepID=A0A5P1F7Q9_ASPOF|nr:uncharacterized protein A4U43_C04F22870 [Asparagus officinalis]
MVVPASGKKPYFDPVITAYWILHFRIELEPLAQQQNSLAHCYSATMREQAAEAHKSKEALSRRRASSEVGSNRRDSLSVDAILNNSLSSQPHAIEYG